MEKLIKDSIDFLNDHQDYKEVIFGYMDIGSNLNLKIRLNKKLREDEEALVEDLEYLISSITVKENLYLYRGVQTDRYKNLPLGHLYPAKQFTSLAKGIETAKNYGNVILEIEIPKGSHAFYLPAWKILENEGDFEDEQSEEDEEEEILVMPGTLEYKGEINGIYRMKYIQEIP